MHAVYVKQDCKEIKPQLKILCFAFTAVKVLNWFSISHLKFVFICNLFLILSLYRLHTHLHLNLAFS